MKTLYTSNYARNSENPMAYGISCTIPTWYSGKRLSIIAPTWNIVGASKDGMINEEEYASLYYDLLQERGVTPRSIVDALPDGAIMLCYERPLDFCHRRLIADWIERETNTPVMELLNAKEVLRVEQQGIVDQLIEF
jgi:hypothetical protein